MRQRQARIDLAEADGTEDNEVACKSTETVARCADFNIRQKHLVAGANLRRNDAVLIAGHPVELPHLLASLCSADEVLSLAFVHDGYDGAVDVVLRFLLFNPTYVSSTVRGVFRRRILQGIRHVELEVCAICSERFRICCCAKL